MNRRLRFLTILTIGLVALAAPAFACPNCSEALGDPNGPLLTGWKHSIMLLMAAPYLVFGGVTLWIVRSARRRADGPKG
ncbi:MAG: hypothetical protein COV76_00195 [Candidatus Omnitrophica bacterium CG11_big_fil_rev_8_21_14_0_20_64_10]|nr:MAG: hypothetical protein COV76_00195 [Candidatus Omnitrophica bacterium CG11_big_fil_rev_8_21_14_0_20_64_10]